MRCANDDRGLGMTELAVAILVLGIVLVGLFPFIVNSIGLAVANAEVGQATRIVSSQLDRARLELGQTTCAPTAPQGQAIVLSAPENETFQAQRIVTCDPTLPNLATVTINVQRLGAVTETISTATTMVVTR